MKTFAEFAEGCPWVLVPRPVCAAINVAREHDLCCEKSCAPYRAYRMAVEDKED